MKNNSIQKNLKWAIILSALTLVTPFIYLKIGPEGYRNYGPNVPDIYILGATILGKDRSWWGINWAYKFQLICILIYLSLAILSYYKKNRKRSVITLQCINLLLLLLFPYWLYNYTDGVICNSDGADLSIYPHVGLIVYVVLLVVNLKIIRNAIKLPKLVENNATNERFA